MMAEFPEAKALGDNNRAVDRLNVTHFVNSYNGANDA